MERRSKHNMKLGLLGLLVAIAMSGLALVSSAQSPKLGGAARLKHAKKVSHDPVSQAEVRAVFIRVNKILSDSELVKRPVGDPFIPDHKTPATRSQIVAELSRVYQSASPSFKVSLRPVKVDLKAIRVPDAATRRRLTTLIAAGTVARYGPLASGPGPGLTTSEFGDALGFFLARISELTNMPSSKWTPYLHG